MAIRYDRTPLDALRPAVRTDEGFLLSEAVVSRVGVFPYRRADGSVRMELRPPDEVFHPDSLASLGGKPVTVGHPSEPVTPDNAGEHTAGAIGTRVWQDALGGHVAVGLTVHRQDALEAIDAGQRELSPGYRVTLDETPGTWQGQRYDAIQRDIRYNHVALVPAGRQGETVALRADAAELTEYRMQRRDGARLAAALNRAIDEMVDDDTSRGEVVARMARAAGISPATVNSILSGEIDNPPRRRLSGFARVLGISLASLTRLVDSDDTDDDREDNMARVTIDGVEYSMGDGAASAVAGLLRRVDEMEERAAKAGAEAAEAKGALAAEKARADKAEADLTTRNDSAEQERADWLATHEALAPIAKRCDVAMRTDDGALRDHASVRRDIVASELGEDWANPERHDDAEVRGAFGAIAARLERADESVAATFGKGTRTDSTAGQTRLDYDQAAAAFVATLGPKR